MKNFSARSAGFIYLVLAAVCVSTIAVAAKIGLRQEASPLELVAFRFFLGAVVLWAYFLCFRRDALRLNRAGLIGSMQAAIINCISTSCYFFALSYIDASLSIVVYTTAFIPAVMLLLIVQGEFPSPLDLIRLVIALIGIYLFVGLVGDASWTGLVLMIATAFFFALYVTIIQLRLGDYDSQTVALYVITFMGIILGAIYLAAGYRLPQFDAVTWGAIFWIAIVATAMARLFLFAGIKLAGSRQAALLAPLDTLLGVLFSVWFLGESVTLQQWVGTFFVIASVALGAKVKSDPVRPKPTNATEIQSNPT